MKPLNAQQQHVVGLLSRFFGSKAARLYDTHGRSLHALVGFARSQDLGACHLLSAGIELAQELLTEELRARPVFDSPESVRNYLRLKFAGQSYESFVVLFVDASNRLISADEMFRGTLTQTAVYPREVVKRALQHNASAVLFAHPHPSGVCEPSAADKVLTRALQSSLALVDVRVLDHFVVGLGKPYSFAQAGLL